MSERYWQPPNEHYWPPKRTGVQPELKTIFCDFNVGPNHYGLLRLTTRGSVQNLKDTGAQVGEYVILADDELWVKAMLVKQDGIMYGKFDWNDVEDVDVQ